MITTDIAIIGAGPVALFAIFEAGLLKMSLFLLISFGFAFEVTYRVKLRPKVKIRGEGPLVNALASFLYCSGSQNFHLGAQ